MLVAAERLDLPDLRGDLRPELVHELVEVVERVQLEDRVVLLQHVEQPGGCRQGGRLLLRRGRAAGCRRVQQLLPLLPRLPFAHLHGRHPRLPRLRHHSAPPKPRSNRKTISGRQSCFLSNLILWTFIKPSHIWYRPSIPLPEQSHLLDFHQPLHEHIISRCKAFRACGLRINSSFAGTFQIRKVLNHSHANPSMWIQSRWILAVSSFVGSWQARHKSNPKAADSREYHLPQCGQGNSVCSPDAKRCS